eukprot:TRINITY_DN7443_c0_g1_i2.p1 TRINITY_DN7443_c0_g1~~TRINITY_DN7443_c0_g1_i2.p1  ORF type:complete len:298 (+),score=51.90 TRINITY_DN7443_c0_g1_i2:85-894(+)
MKLLKLAIVGRGLRCGTATANRRWCSQQVPESLPLTMGDMRFRSLSLLLQDNLSRMGRTVVTRQEYLTASGDVGLNRREAEKLLTILAESGGVHIQDNETIHLKPMELYDEVNAKLGLPASDPCPEITQKLAVLTKEYNEINSAKERADDEVSKRKLRIWALASAGSAVQMSALAFLTFPSLSGTFCLGWDVIEPISFFIMQGYVVAWFFYFFYTKREHSLTVWDEVYATSMGKKAYARRKVNIVRWGELKAEIAELTAKRDAILKTIG